MLETFLKLFDVDFFELGEAFKGLKDENVWKRPAPGLLSVGEIAGHISYWFALRLAGDAKDPDSCKVTSPLIDRRFRYYPATLNELPSEQHLAMTAEQVHNELTRVHKESVAHFKALNPDLSTAPPALPDWSYGSQLEYLVFHIAYHTGQIYSARHLLGEETVDN